MVRGKGRYEIFMRKIILVRPLQRTSHLRTGRMRTEWVRMEWVRTGQSPSLPARTNLPVRRESNAGRLKTRRGENTERGNTGRATTGEGRAPSRPGLATTACGACWTDVTGLGLPWWTDGCGIGNGRNGIRDGMRREEGSGQDETGGKSRSRRVGRRWAGRGGGWDGVVGGTG